VTEELPPAIACVGVPLGVGLEVSVGEGVADALAPDASRVGVTLGVGLALAGLADGDMLGCDALKKTARVRTVNRRPSPAAGAVRGPGCALDRAIGPARGTGRLEGRGDAAEMCGRETGVRTPPQ